MIRSSLPVTVSVTVPAPADEVFAVIADTRNDPSWCPNVDSVEQIEGDGPAIGARFRYTQHLEVPKRGRISFDGEVTIVEMTETAIRWEVTDRFQNRDIRITVTPVGSDSCRVTQTTRARFHEPNIGAALAYPLMARRELRRQFAGLAAHLA